MYTHAEETHALIIREVTMQYQSYVSKSSLGLARNVSLWIYFTFLDTCLRGERIW